MDMTLLLSTSIMSEYFVLVYTLMHSIIGRVSTNVTSAVYKCPDDLEEVSSWDTWYFYQDITYECICAFYATADADEEEIILHEKETIESEYHDDFGDGDD